MQQGDPSAGPGVPESRPAWGPLASGLVLPTLWVVLGIYLLVVGQSLEPIGVQDPFGPGGFPMIIGGVLVFLGVWLGVQEVRAVLRREQVPEDQLTTGTVPPSPAPSAVADDEESRWRPAAVIGVTAGYLLALPVVGFLVATAVTVSAIATLTARRFGVILGVVYPLVVSGVIYLVFSTILGIRLP